PRRFDRRNIPEVAGGFLNTLRNTYSFYALYAGTSSPAAPAGGGLIDRWILAALQRTVNEVVGAWQEYQITAGVKALMRFVVDDLSNWYVRLSRARFWAPDREADPVAVATLHHVLVTVSRLLAPAAPFTSDWLHRALTGESVHLADFPSPAPAGEEHLAATMDAIRNLASLARAAREEGGLRVRQPLACLRVAVPLSVRGELSGQLLDLLRQEVNVHRIELVSAETDLVRLAGRANFRALGKRYGKRTPEAAAAVGRLGSDQLRRLEGGEPVLLEDGDARFEFLPEDVTVEREVATDWLVQSAGPFVAALDPTLTPDLRREGLARELVNRIQRLRKDAGYSYADRIAIAIDGTEVVHEAVRVHGDFIRGETLARRIYLGAPPGPPDRAEEIAIDDHTVTIAVERLHDGSPATHA
ncbi:MAG TPA: DUF5915 domain-containing protein, partial [Gemmatimonadales bacterium]|nr:DUF5915 domain-containing protein [Gemmatimonadales bacterium]